MSWGLRVELDFDSNRKLLELGDGPKGDARRWTWTRVLLYTNRHGSPIVPPNVRESIPRATPGFLRDCLTIGLLELDAAGTLRVHDWELYADVPLRQKVAHFLEKFPHASANELQKAVRAQRALVLAEFNFWHEQRQQQSQTAGSRTGSPNGSPEPPHPVPHPVPQTVPVGVLRPALSSSPRSSTTERRPVDDDLRSELDELAGTSTQRAAWLAAAELEPDRVRACLDAARARGTNAAAYAHTLITSGQHPRTVAPAKGPRANVAPARTAERLERLIRNGAVASLEHLAAELADLELDDGRRTELLELFEIVTGQAAA